MIRSDSGENIGECRRLETIQLEDLRLFLISKFEINKTHLKCLILCALHSSGSSKVVVRVSGLQWVVGNTNSYSCYNSESKRWSVISGYPSSLRLKKSCVFSQDSGQGAGFGVGFSFKLFIIIIYCMSLSLFLVNGANANFVDFHQIQCFQRLHDQIKRKKDYFQFVQLLSQQPFLTERAFNKLRLVQSC